MRRLAQLALVGALCGGLGGQWLALQSVAWTSMLVQNSLRGSLREAVSRTFDGAHPCSLCHVVQKGRSAEKKNDGQPGTPRIDLVCPPAARPLVREFVPFVYLVTNVSLGEFGQSPPVPPPRFI